MNEYTLIFYAHYLRRWGWQSITANSEEEAFIASEDCLDSGEKLVAIESDTQVWGVVNPIMRVEKFELMELPFYETETRRQKMYRLWRTYNGQQEVLAQIQKAGFFTSPKTVSR
ncbi:TPA: hypothetical protein QDB06_000871 [Burkholderia vietnamiensis]|nr:hypothetical protein [Burkholderia vietnamiensis]